MASQALNPTETFNAPRASEGDVRVERTENVASPAKTVGAVAKVTVKLPEVMVLSLKQLGERENKTFTQTLKEAVSLKLFVAGLLDEGAKLLIERKDKTIERIVFH